MKRERKREREQRNFKTCLFPSMRQLQPLNLDLNFRRICSFSRLRLKSSTHTKVDVETSSNRNREIERYLENWSISRKRAKPKLNLVTRRILQCSAHGTLHTTQRDSTVEHTVKRKSNEMGRSSFPFRSILCGSHCLNLSATITFSRARNASHCRLQPSNRPAKQPFPRILESPPANLFPNKPYRAVHHLCPPTSLPFPLYLHRVSNHFRVPSSSHT